MPDLSNLTVDLEVSNNLNTHTKLTAHKVVFDMTNEQCAQLFSRIHRAVENFVKENSLSMEEL